MLSFREYVGAVGSSLKTVAGRNFKKSFPDLLNEHMLLKLDKSGKYVLKSIREQKKCGEISVRKM